MTKLVSLSFVNRDAFDLQTRAAPKVDTMQVEATAAPAIASWYGGYHGGDDYDVMIDGEIVEKDINGEIG